MFLWHFAWLGVEFVNTVWSICVQLIILHHSYISFGGTCIHTLGFQRCTNPLILNMNWFMSFRFNAFCRCGIVMDWMLVQLIVWHGVAQAFAHPSWSCVALKFCTRHVSARLWSKTSTCIWLVSFLFMYSVFSTFVFSMCLSLHWPHCFLAFSNFQLQFPPPAAHLVQEGRPPLVFAPRPDVGWLFWNDLHRSALHGVHGVGGTRGRLDTVCGDRWWSYVLWTKGPADGEDVSLQPRPRDCKASSRLPLLWHLCTNQLGWCTKQWRRCTNQSWWCNPQYWWCSTWT